MPSYNGPSCFEDWNPFVNGNKYSNSNNNGYPYYYGIEKKKKKKMWGGIWGIVGTLVGIALVLWFLSWIFDFFTGQSNRNSGFLGMPLVINRTFQLPPPVVANSTVQPAPTPATVSVPKQSYEVAYPKNVPVQSKPTPAKLYRREPDAGVLVKSRDCPSCVNVSDKQPSIRSFKDSLLSGDDSGIVPRSVMSLLNNRENPPVFTCTLSRA